MDNSVSLSLEVVPSDVSTPLGFEAWLDDDKFYDSEWVKETVEITHKFPETDSAHTLKFVLKNKLGHHTVVDEQGNIVKDALLEIKNLKFDDIELGYVFLELSKYTHDFNGTGQETTTEFFGSMGCNGAVTLEFTSPIYLWLLEKL